jgi:hypothetical protein
MAEALLRADEGGEEDMELLPGLRELRNGDNVIGQHDISTMEDWRTPLQWMTLLDLERMKTRRQVLGTLIYENMQTSVTT